LNIEYVESFNRKIFVAGNIANKAASGGSFEKPVKVIAPWLETKNIFALVVTYYGNEGVLDTERKLYSIVPQNKRTFIFSYICFSGGL
jgi:hypothetical protein